MPKIDLTEAAAAAVADIVSRYRDMDPPRVEAIRNLRAAISEAQEKIGDNLKCGLDQCRPHQIKIEGVRWLLVRRYWFAFRPDARAITAVHDSASDIPNNLGWE